MRFVAKLSTKVKKRDNLPETQMKESLTPAELDEARKFWLKHAQSEQFPEETQDLNRGKEVRKQSHLKALTPTMDEAGVLRVGGRLTRAALPYNASHPMILPKKHPITRLIAADVHSWCHHAGVNHVLSQVQHHYWVVDGRQEVKNWDRDCKVCDKRRKEPVVQNPDLEQP